MPFQPVRSFAIAALGALSLSLAAPSFAQEQVENKVIAVVEGKEITEQDFKNAYASLPPRVRQQGIDKLYPHVLELLIQQVLIVKKGREANLAEDPKVKVRVKVYENQMIHDAYLTREIEKVLTEDVLKAEYARFLETNPPREQVRASHILVESEAEAREIITLIGQGEPFADLAKTRSKGPSSTQGGDLGFFGRGKMVKEFEDIAFALEPNTYSIDPVKTQFGWHVILVQEKRVAEPPSYEQMRSRIGQKLMQDMAGQVTRQIVDSAKIERFDLEGNAIEAPTESLPALLNLK